MKTITLYDPKLTDEQINEYQKRIRNYQLKLIINYNDGKKIMTYNALTLKTIIKLEDGSIEHRVSEWSDEHKKYFPFFNWIENLAHGREEAKR